MNGVIINFDVPENDLICQLRWSQRSAFSRGYTFREGQGDDYVQAIATHRGVTTSPPMRCV